MPQPKLSGMLRGQFRGLSQTKMIECLNIADADQNDKDPDMAILGSDQRQPEGHDGISRLSRQSPPGARRV